MKITIDLRPCKVGDRKALFHRWSDKSIIVDPSPFIGGHRGGIEKYTVGIIEYEDGKVVECFPRAIQFVDSKIDNYCFKD
ncbi:hypothetical protein [Clostridium tertium]